MVLISVVHATHVKVPIKTRLFVLPILLSSSLLLLSSSSIRLIHSFHTSIIISTTRSSDSIRHICTSTNIPAATASATVSTITIPKNGWMKLRDKKENSWCTSRSRCRRHYMVDTDTTTTATTTTTTDSTTIASTTLDPIFTNLYNLCHQGSDIRGTVITTKLTTNATTSDSIEVTNQDNDINNKDDWQKLINVFVTKNNNNNNDNNPTTTNKATSCNKIPILTEFVSYCLGYGFAEQVINDELSIRHENNDKNTSQQQEQHDEKISIAIGHDSRLHGPILSKAFIDGIYQAGIDVLSSTTTTTTTTTTTASSGNNNNKVKLSIHYCSIVTTPACAAFCKLKHCHAAVVSFNIYIYIYINILLLFCFVYIFY
jgi:Phosphoglucomutase/phosphomannomutase, alpha/beta/alpha domain I